MNKEELYKLIKDRKVQYLFGDLENQLDLLPSGKAKIHKLSSLTQYFASMKKMYRDNDFPADETIEQYKERDTSLFDESMEHILESMKFFNTHI